MNIFKDRTEAGKMLANAVRDLKGSDVVVLAIPRGGVVVAREVASSINASLDLIIPRKIGAPFNPELAVGAVTQDGEAIVDESMIRDLGISEKYVKEESARQVEEIKARMKKFRGGRPYPPLSGRIVVIVDDGIATGYTMLAAIRSVKKQSPSSVILAVPVGPPDTINKLSEEADRVVCLLTPEPFYAIGEFYIDFEQVDDEDVRMILKGA